MPGQKNFFPFDGAQFPGMQVIAGSFIVNGASAPVDVFPERNAKFTVSAPATGVYTITLTDGPICGALIAEGAWISDEGANSSARALMKFNNLTLPASGTFRVTTQSATGTDANLSGTQTVNFCLLITSSALALAP